MTTPVLVTGAGGVYGEATIQNLRASSLPTRIYAADTRWHAAGSLRSDEPLVLPRVEDPSYVARITEIVKSNGIRAVFICSGTEINALLDRRDELEAASSGAIFIMPSASLYRMASDKLDTARFLQANGLDFPATVASTDSDAAIDAFIQEVNGYPVIAKPRRGQGSRGLLLCKSREQLRKIKASDEDYVFQELLGDDNHEYTVGVIANEEGEIFGGSIVLRRWLNGGQTSASEVVHAPGIAEYAESIAKVAKPRGYINVQLRMRSEDKPVCFEINARVSSSTGFRTLAGFNEPEMILRKYVLKEKVERVVPKAGLAMVRGLSVSIVEPSIWSRVVPPP